LGNARYLATTYGITQEKFEKKLRERYSPRKPAKSLRQDCACEHLSTPCEQNQRDFFLGLREYLSWRAPRYASILPAAFLFAGLNLRIGSIVFGLALGTSTMGQPS
jgi:hypothetical protein